MEDRPRTKYWIPRFKNDPDVGNKRFKFLKNCNANFQIDPDLVDYVDEDEFMKIEADRIPLGLGTQFGIYPRIISTENSSFFNGEKIVALIAKSLLSGCVDGLHIYRIDQDDKKFAHRRIKYFPNEKLWV